MKLTLGNLAVKNNKYKQCSECGYVDNIQRLRCQKCDGAMFPYKDRTGVGIKKVFEGKVYLNI